MLVTIGFVALKLLELTVIARVLLRPHREPASRIAWVVVVAAIPLVGLLAYLLFGETSIGRKRIKQLDRFGEVLSATIAASKNDTTVGLPAIPDRYASLFRMGESVNGFKPLGGNTGHLTCDSNDAIDCIVADIDSAQHHVHLCFYIWLSDNNGLKVIDALKRASSRGVACRAMADGLGSRDLISSKHWQDMRADGVQLGVALPINHPVIRVFDGRIDLRNHRKIVVIDNWITYCGSQNCADPEFRVKPKFAPWVDILIRFEGPVARHNQCVFAGDWMSCTDEDISDLLTDPLQSDVSGFGAQVIATGPTLRARAASEMFESLIYTARTSLIITTPYFVPNEALQSALCAAANRGVDTTIIFPARNDSLVTAGASRSYYSDLLEAGVKIHEFSGGLLHTKSMTLDDEITLIGSANMDRRSFELNYENNILFYDKALTADVTERQNEYLASSQSISLSEVENWSIGRRLWNNTIAMLGPLL